MKPVSFCRRPDCKSKVKSRGLCNKHYIQQRLIDKGYEPKKEYTHCKVCGKEEVYCRGMCNKCYYAEQRARDTASQNPPRERKKKYNDSYDPELYGFINIARGK